MLPWTKPKTLLGVDVGSSAVKLVSLQRRRDEFVADLAAVEAIPQDIVVDGQIVDAVTLASTLKAMIHGQKRKVRHAATSVSGHAVMAKQISLEAGMEEDLDERVRREAAQQIPFELNEVNLDYQVLSLQEDGSMEVLLVAAKKEKVSNFTSALSLAGLSVQVIDHDPFAVQNCFEFNYQPNPQEIIALLNVGATVTSMNVIQGERSLFTRDVGVGGLQSTEALQKRLNLSFEAAEAAKTDLEATQSEPVQGILEGVLQVMRLEIRKTFDFYRAAGGKQLDHLYVCGGATQMPGMVSMLQQEFGAPAEPLDPFRRIECPEGSPAGAVARQYGPQLAVAVGLALRSFEDL